MKTIQIAGLVGLAVAIAAAAPMVSAAEDAQTSAAPATSEAPGGTATVLRIDSVAPSARQPQEGDPATIWYDDFDGPEKAYAEGSGGLSDEVALGGRGKSMLSHYEKGARGTGGRKVFFGDTPAYRNKAVRTKETFDDVYWRVYVRYQPGWTGGGPAKMSRATSLASEKWSQAMIAHVWSSGESLTLDPASGVVGGKVVTTKYNDFDNLHWLGNKPVSEFRIHSTAEAGRWVCVEARAKLNTPGRKDGVFELWIDGRPNGERKNLDWRGTYTGHGINAVFLETYWNSGSPVTQSRWFDSFVISTRPIGPVTCPRNPVLLRTADAEREKAGTMWEVELAADPEGREAVWRSKAMPASEGRVTVDAERGQFVGPLSGKKELSGGATWWCRARWRPADGAGGAWSTWHQPLATEK